jgi:hypothetical protein
MSRTSDSHDCLGPGWLVKLTLVTLVFLVCSAQTAVLPPVAYDRAVCLRQGSAEAYFGAPPPWCEWAAPPESVVLAYVGQRSVRAMAGAVGLVTATLGADMADRRAAWSR